MQSKTCFLARYRVRPTVIFGSSTALMTPRGQISGLLSFRCCFQTCVHASQQLWPVVPLTLCSVSKTEIWTHLSGVSSGAAHAAYVLKPSLQYSHPRGSGNSSRIAYWAAKLQPFSTWRLQHCNVSFYFDACHFPYMVAFLTSQFTSDTMLNGHHRLFRLCRNCLLPYALLYTMTTFCVPIAPLDWYLLRFACRSLYLLPSLVGAKKVTLNRLQQMGHFPFLWALLVAAHFLWLKLKIHTMT